MAAYRLPFDNMPGWELWNGNWDDPVAGHGDDPFPVGGQAYAFDFGHHDGSSGKQIRAARDGNVIEVRNDIEINTYGWDAKKWADYLLLHPTEIQASVGGGSHVLVRHPGGTVAAYLHLAPNQSFVDKVGEPITQGQIIGLADNTGTSKPAHIHFDVRAYWNKFGDQGPTQPVYFEDANHECWRPRVGDVLHSNNS